MRFGAGTRTRGERGASRRRRTLPVLGLCTALAVSAVSCSSDDGGPDGAGPDGGVPAAKLCGSSFDAPARRALDRLSREDVYGDHVGKTLAEAARDIAATADVDATRSQLCRVHGPGGSPANAYVSIEAVHADTTLSWADRLDPEERYYRVGVDAASSGKGASLSFRCTGGLREDGPPVVTVSLATDTTSDDLAELPETERGVLFMTILASTARALADELGCPEEADIPEGAPEPLASTEYRAPHPLKDWRWWWSAEAEK